MNRFLFPTASSLDGVDWSKIGLKVGLEIHRQLEGEKLFCRCHSGLEEEVTGTVVRKLVPRDSEIGSVDEAAIAEHAKGNNVTYEITKNSCPIELDEEPPLSPVQDIIENAIRICLLLGCDPVDKVQFMRKIVIDGSNPSGFQRTALIGIGGSVRYGDTAEAGITSICLEEDAARRVPDPFGSDRYRLDRAGTPEIEISTEPCISDPSSAISLARRIGDLLRSTHSVKRGIGTIRQDVNVSIHDGTRVEVKLVQDLPMIGKVIRYEAIRQLLLEEVSDHLNNSGLRPEAIDQPFIDVTHVFKDTVCKVISSGLVRGDAVLGVRLKGFAGLMGDRSCSIAIDGLLHGWVPVQGIDDIRRLGPEFAAYVRTATNLKGLFHSDELPGYGITKEEIESVRSYLSTDPLVDGFVLVCAERTKAEKALSYVVMRAKMAFDGVVPEVRKALSDGRTEYMRPLSGSARMYPETDVPGIVLIGEMIDRARSTLPEDPVKRIDRISSSTHLAKENIIQLNNADVLDRFESIISAGCDPRTVSNLLMKGIEAIDEGMDTIPDRIISWIADRISEGAIPKESAKETISSAFILLRNETDLSSIQAHLTEKYSSADPPRGELIEVLDELVVEKRTYILEKGLTSIGPLMGPLMKRFRGKIEGSAVEAELRKRVVALTGVK